MKQLFQNMKTGSTYLEEIPTPQIGSNQLLIRSVCSLISLGTERMLIEFAKANLLQKARQQPERVHQVFQKIKTDGFKPTISSLMARLDEPIPLGYCNTGVVLQTGSSVTDIAEGDRVVSNGPHAELVCVSKNLVAKIPDSLSFEEASFTVVGSIGLQGLRLAQPTFGETAVIIGLGLIGQLTAQLAKANGCNVIGIDIDENKVALARKSGITGIVGKCCSETVNQFMEHTQGTGADFVIITASAHNDEIITTAAQISRKKGRIVLIGVVDLNLKRSDFYEKELQFMVSCSYGPGRYDQLYEGQGIDYPLPYVRWTEKRNFLAILDSMRNKNISVSPLISEYVPFTDTPAHYSSIGNSNSIATIIKYPEISDIKNRKFIELTDSHRGMNPEKLHLGIIGTGLFTKVCILPILSKLKTPIQYLCSKDGISSTVLSRKYSIPVSTTSYESVLNDPSISAVIIATRHNLHAPLVKNALTAHKHVFVEKPLGLTSSDIEEVLATFNSSDKTLTVGFNRRFSPLVLKCKQLMGNSPPCNISITINAGHIPKNHWIHEPSIGGGRIIGEACHFIDLFQFLCGSRITQICASNLGTVSDVLSDNLSILLKTDNGSNGTINYFSNGSKSFPKEQIEIFSLNTVLVIDNFLTLKGYGFKSFTKLKLSSQDKGHYNQFKAWVMMLENGGTPIIPVAEIYNSMRATFAVADSLMHKSWVNV